MIVLSLLHEGDAEIISIDSFNKFHHGNDVVIGITFVKVKIIFVCRCVMRANSFLA